MTAANVCLCLKDFLKTNTEPDDELLNYLSVTDKLRLAQWIDRLNSVRAMQVPSGKNKATKQAQKNRLVGKILEKAVRVLLDGCVCLTHAGNVRSTTSEIDFLMSIETTGLIVPLLRKAGTHMLGEAKCYSSAPKTEWVNELAGLLPCHGASVAVLFSASPPKKLHSDFRVSLALHSVMGKSIIPFGLTQFQRVQNGENFLQVLGEQAVQSAAHASSLTI